MDTPLPRGSRTIATAIGAEWSRTVLDPTVRSRIARVGDLVELASAPEERLAEASVLVTGWGAPRLDVTVLDRVPRLELVLHAAGSVHHLVTPDLWARGIRVVTAAEANARAVVDFTVSHIHLALKNALRLGMASARTRRVAERQGVRGLDGAVVGLVGMGRIGRLVATALRPLDLRVVAYDPYADPAECRAAGIELATLERLLEVSDVVSLHAPLTDGTRGMLRGDDLARLAPSATLINTARGGLIDHDDLARILRARPDLFAVLDVTEPEPLPVGHPLLQLDNVFLTPHIAGSLGTEEARLGHAVVDDLERWVCGLPLEHETREEHLVLSA